jgi:AraC family transcriptional regulator of adaptative response / DNA-3-methyladenine glycosylase II
MSENRWNISSCHDIKVVGGNDMDVENREVCYEIFKSKDARYDGRFFIGIKSTGIYCRPVCKARLPRPENCVYFRTAAEAEKAGFRPCLICRPELAPGTPMQDASSELAAKAAYFIRDNCDSGLSIAELSGGLGCSERHLRRVFKEEYHVTPVEYLQTCRLLLAKQLLTETRLSVIDAAMTAGFGSVRRMNELFRKRYGITPMSLRKKTAAAGRGDTVSVLLGYRAPYAWEQILDFLKPRAIPHVERVSAGSYERAVRLVSRGGKTCTGTICVTHAENEKALKVEMNESLVPVMPQVISKVRQMFDLDCDPAVIGSRLKSMAKYLPQGFIEGIRIPGCFDAFEMVCRAVIGQQITVKAANTLLGRVAEAYGTAVETNADGPDRTFPEAGEIIAMGDEITENFGRLGVIASRSGAIYSAALALAEKDGLRLNRAADPETEIKRLMSIRGIGSWTAQYIVMRTMGYTDAFMETDAGTKGTLPDMSGRERVELSEAWRPWRSYAMMELWNGYGKKPT